MAHLAHYREAHPTVFVITHWVNLISMLMLIFTGFYIHYPFFAGFMSIARGCHMFFAFLIVINCTLRIILAFFVKTAQSGGTRKVDMDYKCWLPQKQNKHQGVQWIKYYLFFKKDHPLSGKYGVPQKLAYLAVPVLIYFMAYTGFCLWDVTAEMAFFQWGTNLVGGLMNMRIIHYFMMWVFIAFTMIHIYLANIEGFAPTFIMFFHKEHGGLTYDPDDGIVTGYDDLGHHKE